MNTNHTPGPWTNLGKIHGLENRHEIRINQKGDWDLQNAVVKGSNAESNARLIAQAPALLAALEDCVQSLNASGQQGMPCEDSIKCGTEWGVCVPCMVTNSISTARAVIAQAKGETR